MKRNRTGKIDDFDKRVETHKQFIACMIRELEARGAMPVPNNVFQCLMDSMVDYSGEKFILSIEAVVHPERAEVLKKFLDKGGWVIDEDEWERCRKRAADQIYGAANAAQS